MPSDTVVAELVNAVAAAAIRWHRVHLDNPAAPVSAMRTARRDADRVLHAAVAELDAVIAAATAAIPAAPPWPDDDTDDDTPHTPHPPGPPVPRVL